MTSTIIWTIAIVAILGLLLALVLYFVAERFKVEEDPRIDEVEKVMPVPTAAAAAMRAAVRLRMPLSRRRTWTASSARWVATTS